MGLIGFTKTLAREGAKYNIKATAIAPIAASPMTETIMPPEMLAGLKPEFVVPLVAVLTHPNGPDASGKVFEVGAGFVAEIRWERSKGAIFKTDHTFTPSAVKERWQEVTDFSDATHPNGMGDMDIQGALEQSKKLHANKQSSPPVRFDGQTVIVTGAGAGLGRIYSLMFSSLGANVVVNDVSEKANAGILRDKSFTAMTEKEWDDVIQVHLRGTFKGAKAVWPIFQQQKYGRILNTASGVGIYGNFGQANYSTAKAAIIGLTKSLAIEGKKYGIFANVLAPSAGTAMTQTIWPQEMVEMFKPDYVAPIVGYLTSKANETTSGKLFEVTGGWAAETRWQRSGGFGFPHNKELTPEAVLSKWDIITGFSDGRATHPTSTQEAIQQLIANFDNNASGNSGGDLIDPEDPPLVVEAKKRPIESTEFSYTEQDVILYNLGIGASEKELQWVFEGHDDFQVLPTFGVIPQFQASAGLPFDWVPNFNPAKLLHGEQYLAIKTPIPTSGTLVNEAKLLEVLDKGKQTTATSVVYTKDKKSGEVIFENQSTVVLRGSGGFGGKKQGKSRGAASASNTPPKRAPDAVVEEKTLSTQAALYRLSGDANPLHIQPEFAAIGGFDRPILYVSMNPLTILWANACTQSRIGVLWLCWKAHLEDLW
ncbi:hypothetical protein FRC18_001656 [Serendipita sp. 400]|nr:hypothetical protein FRC18_001656 [Serendipita sp. 400]